MIDEVLCQLEDDEPKSNMILISDKQRKFIISALKELKFRRAFMKPLDKCYYEEPPHEHAWVLASSHTGSESYKCDCGQWKHVSFNQYSHWWMI